MKKLILIAVAVTLITVNPSFAIGPVEKGVIIGVLGVLGIQQVVKHSHDHEESGHYHYHPREHHRTYRYSPRDNYRSDCIWVTQYDRYDGSPAGYKRYCR